MLKWPHLSAGTLSMVDKLALFTLGSYTTVWLGRWQDGVPKVIGWYDTRPNDRCELEREKAKPDTVDSKILDPLPGRRYWNGKYWSACLSYLDLISENDNEEKTAFLKTQRGLHAYIGPGPLRYISHTHLQFRGRAQRFRSPNKKK